MISQSYRLRAPAWWEHRPPVHPSRWLPALRSEDAHLREGDVLSPPAGMLSATRAHARTTTTTPHPVPGQGRGHPGGGGTFPPPATPPAKNHEASLSTRRARDMEVIARADLRNRKKWQRIVDAGARAPDIDDEGNPHPEVPPPPGFSSWREYQIACDFRRPGKLAPAYVQVAARVATEGQKADAHQGAPPNLNVDVQIYVRSDVSPYPVIDLDPIRRR